MTVNITLTDCGLFPTVEPATCTLPEYWPGGSPWEVSETVTGTGRTPLAEVPDAGVTFNQLPPLWVWAVVVQLIDPTPVFNTEKVFEGGAATTPVWKFMPACVNSSDCHCALTVMVTGTFWL